MDLKLGQIVFLILFLFLMKITLSDRPREVVQDSRMKVRMSIPLARPLDAPVLVKHP